MTYLFKTLSFLILTAIFIDTGYSTSKEASITAEEISITTRLGMARSLREVHDIGTLEYEKRLQTWTALKGGKDTGAKKGAKASLEELREWIATRCCQLTGLTGNWETSSLRIRHGFFTEAEKIYDEFGGKLVQMLMEKNLRGTLTSEEGKTYGELLAQAGQRAKFYKTSFEEISREDQKFSKGGTGVLLSKFTGGYTQGLSQTLGEYFYSGNSHLALLLVSKEEVEIASKLNILLESFQEPLGISGKIEYLFPLASTLAKKREALEGDLPLSKVQEYLDNDNFWRVNIFTINSTNLKQASQLNEQEAPTSLSEGEPEQAMDISSSSSLPQDSSAEHPLSSAGSPKKAEEPSHSTPTYASVAAGDVKKISSQESVD